MRAKSSLVTAVALVGSSLLYGNQIQLPRQDNRNNNQTSADIRSARAEAQSKNQNTKQGTSKGGPGGGGTTSGGGSGPRPRARMVANAASKLIDEIMSDPERSIPTELFAKAQAIAIFPNIVKGASIIGGDGGQGVISKRMSGGGWGAPAFFNLSDDSSRSPLGARNSDYVLVIMSEDGVYRLLKDKFELGIDGRNAAGPVGRVASASTHQILNMEILSYARVNRAFRGVALKGVVISPDDDFNKAIYQLEASELFSRPISEVPAEVRILPITLARYSSRK